jgi:hypothetical protein
MDRFGVWAPRMLSVLRIMAALLFMEHGLMKLLHFPAAQPGVPDPLPALLMVAAWIGVLLFSAEPEANAEQQPQVPLKALPNRTEQWLDSQRPALPAPANRLIDQIGVRLEGLAPCVQHLDEREPAAMEVRRLVGEELPELVRGYQRVPQQLRRQGPDAQLVEGLRVVESELARMTQQLASGDLDKLATQGKYLELKYRGAEE